MGNERSREFLCSGIFCRPALPNRCNLLKAIRTHFQFSPSRKDYLLGTDARSLGSPALLGSGAFLEPRSNPTAPATGTPQPSAAGFRNPSARHLARDINRLARETRRRPRGIGQTRKQGPRGTDASLDGGTHSPPAPIPAFEPRMRRNPPGTCSARSTSTPRATKARRRPRPRRRQCEGRARNARSGGANASTAR